MKGGTLLATAGLLLWIAQPAARAGVISSQWPPNGNNFDITDSRLADGTTDIQGAVTGFSNVPEPSAALPLFVILATIAVRNSQRSKK